VTRPVLGEETWSRTDTESQGLSGDEEETTHTKVETGQRSSLLPLLRPFWRTNILALSGLILIFFLSFNLLDGSLLDFL
jgi:hypothetical protein